MHELWLCVDECVQVFDSKETKDILHIPFAPSYEVKAWLTDEEYSSYLLAREEYSKWTRKFSELYRSK